MWQREGAAGDGKTFTSGVVAKPPRNAQRPGKRKLIWKREEHQVMPHKKSPSMLALMGVTFGVEISMSKLARAGQWGCVSAGICCSI